MATVGGIGAADIGGRASEKRAIESARLAVRALRERGVTALLTGSLAEGRFDRDSDVDFLITAYPASLKYRIEGLVEDYLRGFRFDVIYLDETPAWRARTLLSKARDLCAEG